MQRWSAISLLGGEGWQQGKHERQGVLRTASACRRELRPQGAGVGDIVATEHRGCAGEGPWVRDPRGISEDRRSEYCVGLYRGSGRTRDCIDALGSGHHARVKAEELLLKAADSRLRLHSSLATQDVRVRIRGGQVRVRLGLATALPRTRTAHRLLSTPL